MVLIAGIDLITEGITTVVVRSAVASTTHFAGIDLITEGITTFGNISTAFPHLLVLELT